MKFYIGTSGYSYKEWKGVFYPPKLPAKQMLAYYGAHFQAVEINDTFKRLPTYGTVAVSFAAELQEGRAALASVPRFAADQASRGVRIPPCLVVRRRGL